jgi:hypothetical protein
MSDSKRSIGILISDHPLSFSDKFPDKRSSGVIDESFNHIAKRAHSVGVRGRNESFLGLEKYDVSKRIA